VLICPVHRQAEPAWSALALMAERRSNAVIADRLVMSPKTLEAHVRQILQKLDLDASLQDHRRVLAVLHDLRSAT
jgi:serine/threonine-protein kinase